MTVAPDVPALQVHDPEQAIEALRGSGLRISTARRLVIEALFAADGPVSASALARRLSLEESSVYRNLEVLEQRGLARHVHLGHGPGLYVLAGRDRTEFLYCEGCGAVTVLEPHELDAIRDQIHDRFGLTARFAHFPIVGLCSRCAAGDGRAHTH
ncbi:MAG TPA: transcriptional repressor [Solirubrobacteraceae bacterium]|nr:transcriptional repressor [Solirubrobacteraceae bacterium]